MPTGYTSIIKDGITFKDFTLNCARAFGALVTLQDDMTAKIPDEFAPSSYHKDRLKESLKELEEINDINLKEAGLMAIKDFKTSIASYNKTIENKDKLKNQYNSMLKQVHKWTPPSSEHEELKNFMIDQIEESISWDCDYPEVPVLISAQAWKDHRITISEWNVNYHQREWAKEVESCNSRTDWIRKLRESLE